jgi:hypothetical protein
MRSTIALTQPHAAYAAFTHGSMYISRTIPEIQDLLQPLETAIHQHFTPALTGREACSALERDLLALPTRLGGMGLANPTSNSAHVFPASLRITAPLVALIASQDLHKTVEKADELNIKKQVKKTNRELQQKRARDTTAQLTPQLQRSVELAQEKGSPLSYQWRKCKCKRD